jgi:hypothetical protein
MIDYSKFCLPKANSRNYDVMLPNVAAYATLKGMEDVPELLCGRESETVAARNTKNALSSALRSYGVKGAALDNIIESIQSAGMENFVNDLGENPPQPKKMKRYIENFLASIKCGTNEGEEYRREFRDIHERKKKYFQSLSEEELVQEYYRIVDAVRKASENARIATGHDSL